MKHTLTKIAMLIIALTITLTTITSQQKTNYMPNKFNFADFGMQAAQDVVGAGLGLALGGINDKRQLKQQGKLQRLQIQGQKEMTSYNQAAALKMWQDTNYSAQMEQLKKAGLNPGMIYGMSGGGGATAAVQGGNVTGAHAPTGGGEAIAMGSTMAQLGLMRAQKELIEAQKNKEIATTPAPGQTQAKIGAETTSILQGVENAKAQQKLTEVETDLHNIDKEVKGKTITEQQDIIIRAASKAVEEIDILHQQLLLDRQTRDMKVEYLRNQIANEVIKIAVQETNIKVSEAEIQKWTQEIAQGWKHIDIQGKQLIINALETDIKQKYPGLWNVIGRILNDTGNKIGEILGEKPPKTATQSINK